MMPFLQSIHLLEPAQRGPDIWAVLQRNMDMELWRTLIPLFTLWGTLEEKLTITPTPDSRMYSFSSMTPAEPNNKFSIHWNSTQGQSKHLLKIALRWFPTVRQLSVKFTDSYKSAPILLAKNKQIAYMYINFSGSIFSHFYPIKFSWIITKWQF